MSAKPLPCPFCGSVRLVVLDETTDAIGCYECGAEGPPPQTPGDTADAIRAWNTRSGK
jgi:Lar family restriction alleviation protein